MKIPVEVPLTAGELPKAAVVQQAEDVAEGTEEEDVEVEVEGDAVEAIQTLGPTESSRGTLMA